LSLFQSEGAGNAGRTARPQPCVQNEKSTQAKSPQVCQIRSGIPRANGFNGFLRALPGEPGLLSPSPARSSPHRLDISVGISGPHDFAVRLSVHSSAAPQASTASRAQRFVTIAKRPSCGRGTRGKVPVICPTSQAKMPARDWHDGQIRCHSGSRVAAVRNPFVKTIGGEMDSGPAPGGASRNDDLGCAGQSRA
jgi:hypothetical protein